MNLSIIIVSWNTRQLLDNCLASIYQETKNINFEIFVADNASADGSAEMIKQKYPGIKLIANQKNIGFAAANNQALRQAAGRYILILNPDTVILNDAIEKSITILDSRLETGILGPLTHNKDMSRQKTIGSNPSLLAQVLLLTKLKYIFPKVSALKKYYRPNFDYSQEAYVDQVQGSFMLIKKEVFNKIGLFDEKFFIWFEEVDLCLRARQAGYKILYTPQAEIVHLGGESFKQVMTLKKQRMYNRSLFHYFRKHKPKWQYYILRSLEIPSLLIAALAGLAKRFLKN